VDGAELMSAGRLKVWNEAASAWVYPSGGSGGSQPNLSPSVQDLLDAGVIATPAWTALTNMRCVGTLTGWYSAAYCKPDGSANLFAAEDDGLDTTKTGASEPDWDGDAPNYGDTVSDGSYTWRNIGPFSAWPPTPTTWAPDTAYGYMDAVWPTDPFGVVFMPDPGYAPPGAAADEPDWGDINGNDGYSAQAPGYWLVAVMPPGDSDSFYAAVGANLFDAVGQGRSNRFYGLGPQAGNLLYAQGQDAKNWMRARGVNAFNEIRAEGAGSRNKIGNITSHEAALISSVGGSLQFMVSDSDPSAGGGLAHDGPALCVVADSGAGTTLLFVTTGPGDTDWAAV